MNILSQKELLQFKGIWHSIKVENIASILNSGVLEARTTQRYWQNGMVYRDNQGKAYHDSHYMKGWSMTRDKDYAFGWACITFLLDWEAIKRDFKVKTISWNYRSASCNVNYDKEREEFIVSNIMSQTFDEMKEEYEEITDDIYDNQGSEALKEWRKENGMDIIEYWQRKGVKTISLDKYLKGVFISKETYDIYEGKGFEAVENHPLFKGFISQDEARERHQKSMKPYIYRLKEAA